MKNDYLKKFMVLALALILTMGLTACGGSGGNDGGGSGSGLKITDEQWEVCDEGLAVECDLGVQVSGDWTMSPTLDKIDYSDLSLEGEGLEKRTSDALEASGLENFVLYTDFEPTDVTKEEAVEYEITVGDLLYTSGLENDDMDQSVIEVGAYNNPQDDMYYQYTILSSKTFYTPEEFEMAEFVQLLNDAYGVQVDEALMNEGVKAVFDRAANYVSPEGEGGDDEVADEEEGEGEDLVIDDEGEDYESDDAVLYDEDGNEISLEDLEGLLSEEELQEMLAEEGDGGEDMDLDEISMGDDYSCSIQQTVEVSGDGWKDTVLVTITGQKMEEGKAFLYASVERDRHYE